jgi:hypothetical protein
MPEYGNIRTYTEEEKQYLLRHIHPLNRHTEPPPLEAHIEDPEALEFIKNGFLAKMWKESDWYVTFCEYVMEGHFKARNGWKYFEKRLDELRRKRIQMVAKAKKEARKSKGKKAK